MPPQPLSRVASDAGFRIANVGDRPLVRHPNLAVLAMEAIASWSNVESFMLNLFITLFGGNKSLAANIFLAMEIQSAKTKAIQVAADAVLQGEPKTRQLLNVLIAIAKTNQKSRDKLAHGTWGDSASLPDALLLVSPKALVDGIDQNEIFVYRESDFIEIIQANERLCEFGLRFNLLLMSPDATRKQTLCDALSQEPEFRERLDRQA